MITERGCLSKYSGANNHIHAGINCLNHHFKISLFTSFLTKRSLVGRNQISLLFFLVYFTELMIILPKQLIQLYLLKPTFIYERYHILNFNTLLICKCLKIPHFFEINGLWKENHRNRFLSWLEIKLLSLSNFCFCLGLRGRLISPVPHLNLENGVSQNFWKGFKNHYKKRKTNFNICFLGSLMQHHKLGIIGEAFELMPPEVLSQMQLHFIGPINQRILKIVESCPITIALHGGHSKKNRIKLLKMMDCGFISGGSPYASFMKLFEYGSAKCPVIAPKTSNLKHWLEDNCIFFYQPNNSQSCAKALMEVYQSPDLSRTKAQHLYQLIGKRFLWEKTFSTISTTIANHL